MSEKKILHFELLGAFSCEGMTLKAGRKALSFLQYLIVHHERNISVGELIEEFWPEYSNAPSNALRRILSRVRALLKEVYPEEEDLLLTLPDCYAWNPRVQLELDTKRFERACLEAMKTEGAEKMEALLSAVALYKGDFLAANDSRWAVGARQYYRALCLDACRVLLPLLEKKEKWIEVLGICEQGYKIDFTLEDFTVCRMRALIALGQPGQAIERYELFRERMLEEFQMEPSERVEEIRMWAAGVDKKELEIREVFDFLREDKPEDKAFFCTFEMFRNIVALESRHLARSGGNSTVVIARLGRGGSVPVTDIRRLERILLEGLRAGDPVARLEAGSYIFMLSGANTEKAQIVMSRIDRTFHKTYRHSQAGITYHTAQLPMNQE